MEMEDKLVILIIEDDLDTAGDYKEQVEALIDVEVIPVFPPVDLLDLRALVIEHHADAVILDEVLQHRSDATYMGIDGFEYLHSAFPHLPIDILTEYPPGPELKQFPTGNLVRKRDFFEEEAYRNDYLQKLHRRIMSYRRRREEQQARSMALRELQPVADGGVTEEFVQSLVQLHFQADDGIEQIVWVKSDEERQIRLIEINRTALPTESVQAFRFAPSEDVPFPIYIADVRPTEWERIQSGDIPLPEGWSLEGAQVLRRSDVLPEGREDVG